MCQKAVSLDLRTALKTNDGRKFKIETFYETDQGTFKKIQIFMSRISSNAL